MRGCEIGSGSHALSRHRLPRPHLRGSNPRTGHKVLQEPPNGRLAVIHWTRVEFALQLSREGCVDNLTVARRRLRSYGNRSSEPPTGRYSP